MLSAALKGPLTAHRARVKAQHDADLAVGRAAWCSRGRSRNCLATATSARR